MGFKNLNQSSMRFLIVAALCAIASAAPEGRRLRPEEHWRPAQGRDLSKYKPRAAMVDANGDDLMEKINRVAAEMGPLPPHPTRRTSDSPRLPVESRAPPSRREGSSEELRPLSTPGPGRWLSSLMTPGSAAVPSSPRTTSSPLPTVPMAPATSMSCPEPTT